MSVKITKAEIYKNTYRVSSFWDFHGGAGDKSALLEYEAADPEVSKNCTPFILKRQNACVLGLLGYGKRRTAVFQNVQGRLITRWRSVMSAPPPKIFFKYTYLKIY